MLLSPWQDGADGQLRAAPLRVVLPPEEKDLLQLQMNEFPKGAAVAVEVTDITPPDELPWWNTEAALRVQRALPGEALLAFRRRLEQPVVLADALLGPLTLEREHHWFRGSNRCRGGTCEITVKRSVLEEDRDADQRDVDTGRETILRVEARFSEVLASAAADLHAIWDESWRDERLPLGQEVFAKHLKVKAIELSRTRTTVWLDAGDLFHGHEVELRLSPSAELREVCLAG